MKLTLARAAMSAMFLHLLKVSCLDEVMLDQVLF